MDWRVIIFWSVLFKGLYCDSTLPEERGESCYLLNPDGRETPNKTNSAAGNLMNLFPNVTVTKSGRIKSIAFFTYNTGNAYVAFWKPLGNRKFQLRTKLLVSSNTRNHLEVYAPAEHHYVEEGNVLGIHFKNEDEWGGLIAYETDRSSDGSRTPGMLVHDFYNPSDKDYNWPIGHNITVGGLKGYKRGVALQIDICECNNNTFGEDCRLCSDHCLEQPCNSTTGHCEAGCKDGYQGHRCDTECGFQRFGAFCAEKCHCRSNTTCDAQYGTCLHGCADGWEGIACSIASTQSRGDGTSNYDNTGWIVAVAILTVLFVSFATSTVLLAVIYQRLLKAKATSASVESTARGMSFDSPIRSFSKGPTDSSEKETEFTYESVAEVATNDVIKPECNRLNVYQNY